MSERNPYDDMPAAESEACDLGSCRAPWAWEADRVHGPRKLRLCERHASRWLAAEREMDAELDLLARVDDLTAAKVRELAMPIAAELGVGLPRILATDRTSRVALARHRLFCALWRAGFSIGEIGRVLDRDHTTVIAGIRKTLGPDDYKAAQVQRALDRVRRVQ